MEKNQQPSDQSSTHQQGQQGQGKGQNQENLEKEVLRLQQELAQMTATCKRALADLDNYKKSMAQETVHMKTTVKADILKDFLTILDSFERAQKFFEKLPEEHRKGLENMAVQCKQIFQKYGVEEMPGIGEKFDPRLHEALMQVPGEAEKILDIFEKGYIIKDLVLRPAKVKIGKSEAEQSEKNII